jgi:hypothetical protein
MLLMMNGKDWNMANPVKRQGRALIKYGQIKKIKAGLVLKRNYYMNLSAMIILKSITAKLILTQRIISFYSINEKI